MRSNNCPSIRDRNAARVLVAGQYHSAMSSGPVIACRNAASVLPPIATRHAE